LHNLSNNTVSCRNYLKNFNSTNQNLTIIDKIDQLPILYCSKGKNLFLKSEWNMSKPFIVKKGYVPIIRKYSIGSYKLSYSIDTTPDYICLSQNSTQNNSVMFNLSKINYFYNNKTYINVFINFVFNNPNQTFLSNYNLSYVYTSFGSFSINVFTLFGGNILSPTNKFINVQKIEAYPFEHIQMNYFEINCDLDFESTKLECTVKMNISNYANSFQPLFLDYGDGTNQSFTVNPYCNLFLII
jgi:hypothetical protein